MGREKRDIPWLDKRGKKYYVFWYNDAARNVERFSLRTEDAVEAQGRYAAFLTEGKALFSKNFVGLGVSTILDAYYEEHCLKLTSEHRVAKIRMAHLKRYFAQTPVNEIGIPECRKYVEFREAEEVHAITASRELAILRAAANHAKRWKRLSSDQMPTFELPKAPVSSGVWLFHDELQALRAAAASLTGESFKGRTLAFIDLCYYTASRKTAIERLEWSRIDLVNGRIKLAYDSRITRKRRPVVPIDPLLLPTLTALHKTRTDDVVIGGGFQTYYWFEKAAEKAGLLELPAREGRPAHKLTPHVLRHSRATHLLQAGKSPWAVAGLLGDNVQTVTSVYGHHCAKHSEELFDTPTGAQTGQQQAVGVLDLSQILG